ncbi:hypothetical protein D3C75_1293160 [compost metagenome]
MQVHDSLHNGQAETVAHRCVGGVRLIEFVEDPGEGLRIDHASGVAEHHFQ